MKILKAAEYTVQGILIIQFDNVLMQLCNDYIKLPLV